MPEEPVRLTERDWMLRLAETVTLLLAAGDVILPLVVRTLVRDHARTEMEAFEAWKTSEDARWHTADEEFYRNNPDGVVLDGMTIQHGEAKFQGPLRDSDGHAVDDPIVQRTVDVPLSQPMTEGEAR